jgi:pimeloyl-ACP methyl ester carboxylesterase
MKRPASHAWNLPGSLVSIPARGRMLDGFWRHDAVPKGRLLILVHGMGGDFHHSILKKTLMDQAAQADCDLLSFNNRGSGDGVRTERFADCLADLDAAVAFGRRQGYRRFILAGHSTGSQKIAYYQSRRKNPAVEALIHLAPGDDYAILQRDMKSADLKRLASWCRRRVASGHGDDPVPARMNPPGMCAGFSASRFLSIADPKQTEAGLFQYAGPMRVFSRLMLPMLVLFGDREEFACLSMSAMEQKLRSVTLSTVFDFKVINGADHGFHGREQETARAVMAFLNGLPRKGGRR